MPPSLETGAGFSEPSGCGVVPSPLGAGFVHLYNKTEIFIIQYLLLFYVSFANRAFIFWVKLPILCFSKICKAEFNSLIASFLLLC